MTDEEFVAWLHRPLTLAELLAIELRESARQWGFCEATEVADQLEADTAAGRAWDEVQAGVALRDLAECPANPYPEARQAGCRHRP